MFATPKQTGRSSLLVRSPIGGAGLSGRRSLQATPRGTPSIATKVARAEHVLEETDLHVVKALNYPVPVQIQENLKSNQNVSETGIKLHQNGWGWLVCGSKVLLWKYCTQQLTAQCYQLRLPGHNWCSDFVAVHQRSGAGESQLSVLACSPHGGLYYWSNVLRDTSLTCEGLLDVGDGGGIFCVTALPGDLGFVVATTAAALFLVAPPSTTAPQTGLSVRQLQLLHGVFSGIGRRVSSLFFGSHASEVQESRKLCASDHLSSGDGVSVFLLTSSNLQKWHIDSSSEQLSYDVALATIVKEATIQEGWVESATPIEEVSVWIMDMQLSVEFVVVLFAVRCKGRPTVEHGLALFQAKSDVSPLAVDKLIRLNHRIDCPVGREQVALDFSLHGAPAASTVVLHSRSAALLANVNVTSSSSADVVKFPSPDLILGTGHLTSQLLLFTLLQGVVAISQTAASSIASPAITETAKSANTSRAPSSLLATPTQATPYASSRSPHSLVNIDTSIEALKNAFSEYLDGNLPAARDICDHHFPSEAFFSCLDTIGDLAVVQLSEMVLDDPPPTSDPRWNDSMDGGTSNASLILIYRLEQKFQAHTRYVQFVTDVGLLDRLTCVCVRGHVMLTRLLLCEHAEKIQAAITLRKLHNPLVDQAVKATLQRRPSSMAVHPTLTKNDLFYSHISQLEDIFPALLQHEEEVLSKMDKAEHRLEVVMGVGGILDSLLHDAIFYRQSKTTLYQSSSPSIWETVHPEFIPWTASDTRRGTKICLMEQLHMMIGFDSKDFPGSQERKSFWSLYVRLTDLLCDGYVTQLKALEQQPTKHTELKKTYESHRYKFLLPLLESDQYQLAVELGEKYEDFHVLVHLCESLEDKAKLQEYMTRFEAQGFSDFLFKQYLDGGKLKKLLSFSDIFPRELSTFLKPHNSLSWLHHTATKEYGKAYKALGQMASSETQYVAKKKTLFSLSKLALLASSEDDKEVKVQQLNDELHHIQVQQSLPTDVLEGSGLDSALMPPLPPSKIIELYIGEENPTADELDFITALEYLDFAIPEREEARSLKAFVWSQAVLRNDWSQLSTDDPLAELQDTLFFRIVEEAFRKGLDMLALLPDLNSLLSCPQLVEKGLSDNPSFRLLMKAGYEQVARVQSHIAATYASTGQELPDESMT